MDFAPFSSIQSRRDFLKKIMVAFSLGHLKLNNVPTTLTSEKGISQFPNIDFKYKTMTVAHFKELQEDIDKLRREKGKLSRNKTYRSYIDELKFVLPEDFPDAKSIIIMSVFTRMMYVSFQFNGKKHDVKLPPQYYDAGVSIDDLKNVIKKEVITQSGVRIERANQLHLKLLAVRSGLGKYGINNLCYVDGMGSFLTLYAFFTDFQFKEDHWHKISLLDACRKCPICYSICPTNCISKENFVIDVGKCITLYNEIEGKFPRWILPSMHNALIGCMKCQLRCPVNEKYTQLSGRLGEVTEEETWKILRGKPDEQLLSSLSKKLRKFPPASSKELFPIFTRNLGALRLR
jgi:epoxyqueuosine reductase